jgi:DNA-binding CsgD family transcriptional regulator
LMLKGARQALTLLDGGLAERLARAALDAGAGFPAELALGEALMGQHQIQQAEEVFASLGARAQSDEQRACVALARASNLFWGLWDLDRAQLVLDSTAAAITDPHWLDELATLRGMLLLFSAPMPDVVTAVAGPLSRHASADRILAQCLTSAIAAWAFAGEFDRAFKEMNRGAEAAFRCSEELPLVTTQFLSVRLFALMLSGRLPEASSLAAEAFARANEQQIPEFSAFWSAWVGYLALREGRAATALRRLKEASVSLEGRDLWGVRHWVLGLLAQAAALCGDSAGADEAVREADRTVWLGEAWAAAARGELSTAGRLAQEGADRARLLGQHAFEAFALHEAVRLGQASAVLDRLVNLASVVQGRLAPAFISHARARVSDDGSALDAVAACFDEQGLLLCAAEAAAEAAVSHARAGLRARAGASASRSRALADRCEGAVTPSLAWTDPLLSLTPRQRDVAQLASRGLSNREIARRLFVSVRTVEGHLYQVFAKLGITGRADLASVFPTSPK